jgi:hypothetical protein
MRGSTDSEDEVPEHDQQLVAQEAHEPEDAEAVCARDDSQHDEDEDQAGRVEAQHQQAERLERGEPVLADDERHRAERADRREPHDHADDANSTCDSRSMKS